MSEWKKVQTGTDEDGEALYEYQFGGDIDGTFVPAVTKNASYVEHLHSIAQAQAEQEKSETTTATDTDDEQ